MKKRNPAPSPVPPPTQTPLTDLVKRDKENRQAEAVDKINSVLKSTRCVLVPVVQITGTQIAAGWKIVAQD